MPLVAFELSDFPGGLLGGLLGGSVFFDLPSGLLGELLAAFFVGGLLLPTSELLPALWSSGSGGSTPAVRTGGSLNSTGELLTDNMLTG